MEEAFEFLDQIRVPQNPSRILTLATRCYSSYNIAGYLSPETALDMELMTPEVPTMPLVSKSEIEQVCPASIGANIITRPKEIDVMDGPENSVYRPTDEPEPWDLIQLNVQASVMCLTSKVKSFCSRLEETNSKSDISKAISDCNKCEVSDNLRTTKSILSSGVKQKEGCLVNQDSERSSPVRKISISEAQVISTGSQNPVSISSSVGSDSSHVSGPSASSGLGTARTNESQVSSCTATPDVSPCEEDSGIGLERGNNEVEKTDCLSEGGLSVDDEKREDLLPLDKAELRQRDESAQNDDSKYGSDTGIAKSGKLESIMEQSIEDLGMNGENEAVLEKNKDNSCDTNNSYSEVSEDSNKREVISELNYSNSVCDKTHDKDKTNVESQEKSSTEIAEKNQLKKAKESDTEVVTVSSDHVDWVGEVRPSMKKLRQAMDGLMRTARLVHSVFRLQQTPEAAQQSHAIKYRRDICFSQAVSRSY